MRTCPHMSPGCSSPWDLNIAPARHYCCHSQTYSDLLTSPAQKRLDADTFTANVFHQSGGADGTRHALLRRSVWESMSARCDAACSPPPLLYLIVVCWGFLWLIGGRQTTGDSHSDWTVGRFSTPGARPEVRVCRPPTRVIVRLGHVSAAGSCSATCGQCVPSHKSLSHHWHLTAHFLNHLRFFFFLTALSSCWLSLPEEGRKDA